MLDALAGSIAQMFALLLLEEYVSDAVSSKRHFCSSAFLRHQSPSQNHLSLIVQLVSLALTLKPRE